MNFSIKLFFSLLALCWLSELNVEARANLSSKETILPREKNRLLFKERILPREKTSAHETKAADSVKAEQKAKEIIKEAKVAYYKLKAIEVHYSLSITSKNHTDDTTMSGVIVIQPSSNKFNLTMQGIRAICDGKQLYSVDMSQKEVKVQAIDSNSEMVSPVHLFSALNRYRCVYKKALQVKNQQVDIVDLFPLRPGAVARAQVCIFRRSRQLYQVRFFDIKGGELAYTVVRYIANPAVDAGKFSFDKKNYPGFDLIDLR